jgi:hypothetical protein
MAEASLINFTHSMGAMSLMYVSSGDFLSQFVKDKAPAMSSKAFSINTYEALGSMFRCLLDGFQITENPIKTGKCARDRGFQITFTRRNNAASNRVKTNNYAALGSMCPCILDARDTLNNHIKTDSYAKERVI